MRPFILVANWKMYFLPEQAVALIEEQYKEIDALCRNTKNSFVVCPSYEAIFMIQQATRELPVCIGAQDCSAYPSGAYTGQVSAASLKQLGCSYSIVGHSEVRAHNKQTNQEITQKVAQLLQNNITPIVCCGESQKEQENNLIAVVLEQQLSPIFTELNSHKANTIIVAYEPIWSIGTGQSAQPEQIATALTCIKNIANKHNYSGRLSILYGGSVNSTTIKTLKKINNLDGFLIGSASTNFQELKKIVDSL